MAYYGVQARIRFWVWDTANNVGVDGDEENLTLTLTRDGSDSVFAGTVTDLGGGLYSALVSATLMQATEVSIRGTSTTADVTIFPIETIRTVRLPNVQEGTEGGIALTTANGVLTAGQQGQLDAVEDGVDAIEAKAALIGSDGQIVVTRNYLIGEKITIHQGVDYKADDGHAIRLTDVGGTSLPAADSTVRLNIGSVQYSGEAIEVEGVVEASGDGLVAVFNVLATDTAALIHVGQADYYVLDGATGAKLDVVGRCDIARGPRVVA